MSVGGFPGNPPTRISLPAIDFMAGCYAALGVMYALRHRDQTGEGQLVDIALFDLAISLVGITAMEMKRAGQTRTPVGNATYWTIANSFKAQDGWVFLSLATNSIWKRFCKAIGAENMLADEKYTDDYNRFVHREEIVAAIQEWASERTVKEILKITEERHVPCTPVNDLATAISDPQVRAREMLVDVDYGPDLGIMPIPGLVTKMSKSPGKIDSPCPSPGQDNQEVYARILGYGPEELKQLESEGVI